MASLQELLATSALLVTCEKIAGSGRLPEDEERDLRVLIVRVCRAFDIPTIAEREFDNVVSLVGLEMRAPA
jgi:hypothetical protein